MAEVTVVFTDLTESMRVFESLGNVKATQTITRMTQWIGKVCQSHNGQVIKFLGDGVLIVFIQSIDAIEAVVKIQQLHQERVRSWPELLKIRVQVGIARGEIIEHDNDFYGDAVNLASRLCNLSGPDQILVTDAVVEHLPSDNKVHSRSIGSIPIRGRLKPCLLYRIEWQNEVSSEIFTVAVNINSTFVQHENNFATLALDCLDFKKAFATCEMPIFLGRDKKSNFFIQDARVSRRHARIEWRNNRFHLKDISSYGTWVRFSEGKTIMALRRQECVLLMNGELSLGASFEDLTVPTVSFRISNNFNYLDSSSTEINLSQSL